MTLKNPFFFIDLTHTEKNDLTFEILETITTLILKPLYRFIMYYLY